MLKQLFATFKVLTLAIVLSFGLSYALAWTSPTATPPGNNVVAPLNAGDTNQIKTGGITAGSLTTTGLTNTGTLRVTGGAGAARVLTSDASGNATWQVPSAGSGDNLGDHTATQALNLGANNITASGADTTFGGITLQGDKNGYGGINFKNTAGTTNYATVMANAANAGFYNAAHNGWLWYVNNTGDSTQTGIVYSSNAYTSNGGYYLTDTTPHGKQLFTANGNFTVPAGVTRVWVTMVGGGGGGGTGGTGGTRTTGAAGRGGYGAQAVVAQQLTVTTGASYAVTRGAGGGSLAAGGASSFGALASVAGGGPGQSAAAPAAASYLSAGGGSVFGSWNVLAANGYGVGGIGGAGGYDGASGAAGGAGTAGFVLVEW